MSKKKIETVPNQRMYVVHREAIGKNFISISKLNYSKAYRDMSSSSAALGLYIWLVGNQDKFKFAFSPQAIENQLGMARSSCHGAVKRLEELGYLVPRSESSNVYDFYEVSILDEELEQKAPEDDMLNYESPTAPTEEVPSFPIAKPGNFEF